MRIYIIFNMYFRDIDCGTNFFVTKLFNNYTEKQIRLSKSFICMERLNLSLGMIAEGFGERSGGLEHGKRVPRE